MQKIIIGLVLIIVLISGCAGPKSTPKQSTPNGVTGKTVSGTDVDIKGFAFDPGTITVSKGTTVTWTNRDSVVHTITGDNFDSGPISQDKTFSQTFKDIGTFEYRCTKHPSMKTGKVIVT